MDVCSLTQSCFCCCCNHLSISACHLFEIWKLWCLQRDGSQLLRVRNISRVSKPCHQQMEMELRNWKYLNHMDLVLFHPQLGFRRCKLLAYQKCYDVHQNLASYPPLTSKPPTDSTINPALELMPPLIINMAQEFSKHDIFLARSAYHLFEIFGKVEDTTAVKQTHSFLQPIFHLPSNVSWCLMKFSFQRWSQIQKHHELLPDNLNQGTRGHSCMVSHVLIGSATQSSNLTILAVQTSYKKSLCKLKATR